MHALKYRLLPLLLLLLSLVLSSASGEAHKFYVSTTTLHYRPEQQLVQITMQLFIDDVQAVLNQRYDATLRMAPDSDEEQVMIYFEKYLRQKFSLSSNQRPLEYTFLGKEYRNDLLLAYLELPLESLPEALTVQNQLLFDVFEDQKNIVHFKNANYRKSVLLNTAHPQAKILTLPD